MNATSGACLAGAEQFYSRVARHILSCHPSSDLRGATVLLPNYHAAAGLVKALSHAAGLPALLLPRMLTLSDWAASVPLDAPMQSDTLRIAMLYQALRERDWFPDADLWGLSRELLSLMDELTCHHVPLGESEAEFARQLTDAYQARSGEAMQFEARVVHELWYAMASGELDASSAYQLRLSQLAQQLQAPLYVMQTCDLSVPEVRFLESCREKVSVSIFDLREMVADAPDCELLTYALQQNGANLRNLAASLAAAPWAALHAALPPSVVSPVERSEQLLATGHARSLRLFGAHGMEQEAMAADVQVRRWLLAEKKSIAVVVQDRLVARRLRALLERAQVQVQDETGWTFATLSVSTVLMCWLEAVQGDFYYQDVLDLFKSPYLFAEDQAARKQAAYRFEQMVRKHGVVAHLQDYIAVAETGVPELVRSLVRLRQAAAVLAMKAAKLADWLAALHQSMDILGVIQGWRQDAAGQQLLQLLSLWQEELLTDTSTCSFAQWRRWLSGQLDLNTYRDLSCESPVIFTHLQATRWRSFDAVLLLGCDATHLPAPVRAARWFNDAVRQTLGLPMSCVQQAQVRDDLLGLLAMNNTVLVTWQTSQNGEPNLLSPHLEMLRALHLLAYQDDLMDGELGCATEWAKVRCGESGSETARVFPAQLEGCAPSCYVMGSGVEMPRAVVPENLLPQAISPSAYNSLVACPYQYFARHVLHLNELDEVREALDKRDYGSWVHDVLQRFHEAVPILLRVDRDEAEQTMLRISNEVFAGALSHDYLAQAWLLRWQGQIPAYLGWQLANEQAGWHYKGSELPFSVEVSENLILRGRVDRLDMLDAKKAVLDYKTQTVTVLKNKLKEAGEDVQLACYTHAMQADEAAFISLDGDVVSAIAPPEDMPALSRLNIERLQSVFEQMRSGTALPAHGVEKICSYCEMKGLCRKGEWAHG